MRYDILIVGGGIVGLATAYRLLESRPDLKLVLLEKERRLGHHQTGRNSGVLHCGLYYKPGSKKALLSVRGLRQIVHFCRDHEIAHEQCGKIVVAVSPEELPRLETLWERGHANGLKGLRRLGPEEIKEVEPHAAGIAAIAVPEEGIVDFPAVADKLGEVIQAKGGSLRRGVECRKLLARNGTWIAQTGEESFETRFVITCAGLHADRLVRASGLKPSAKIVPFRGEYYELRKERQHLVRNLIYPVPDPKFPFLGVHFTRMIHGGVEAGPNAVLAFAREGYKWTDVNLRDLGESLAFPGLWKFLVKYPSVSGFEILRSISRALFCRALQRLVPEIREDDLQKGPSGVRAQAMSTDGALVEDFRFEQAPGILHVINAPSPGATASLAIGEEIRDRALEELR